MGRPSKYSPEVRDRAVRMVFDQAPEHSSQWAAIRSVGDKLGIRTESLTTDERARLTQLERENFELKRANEILKTASAYFAQAVLLDRRAK
jgi:transposase